MSLVKFLAQLRDLNINIWVENDTLRYKAPRGVVTTELLAEIKARRTEIIDFLKQANAYSTIEPAPQQEYYPVSSAQKRFYILNQIEGAQTSYNISGATLIEGKLDPKRLVETFNKLVQRHEAFRTTFAFINGELVQQIHPEAELTIDYQELEESRVPELINEFIQPFDLSRAPLLRLKLLKVAAEKHVLLYDMDHIISDGVSMGVLVRDFAGLYNGETLPELPLQYKDFAVWQNSLRTEIIQPQEKYWLESFAGEIPRLNLPTDYPRPAVMNYQGAIFEITLTEELSARLKQLSAQSKATLFMTLLAGYNLLLSKLTGSETIIVGTPVAGRQHPGLENIIGMFLNTLALKNKLNPRQPFIEFLEEVKRKSLQVFENQDYQFEMLLEKLKIPRDLSRNPLFDTLLNALNENEFDINNYQFEVGGLKFSPYKFKKNTTTFDLQIYITEIINRIHFSCVYRTSLFNQSTIEYLMHEYIRLLQEIAVNPRKLLEDYRVFHPDDIQAAKRPVRITALYKEFEAAAVQRSIVERFEEQARQYPGQVAAKAGFKALNYETLNKRANQVARLIREKLTIPQPVALLFGNDPELFTGIIGILKAGQAYLPLDPTYPKERLAYMLNDSGATLLVTDHQNVTLAAELSKKTGKKIQVIDVSKINPKTANDNLNLTISPEQVAYIKYTSGSTGRPKGIPQTHHNVLAFIRCYTNELHINPDDKVALFSSYSHSAGAIDIFSMLLNGGTLYPFDLKSEGNMRKVADWLIAAGITIFHSVPMVYRYCTETLAEGERFSRVRLVVLGGEPVLSKDVERMKRCFREDCVLVNMFGATEVIIGTFGIVDQETEITGAQVPIGYPVAEVKIYLLNEANREVPVFEAGEIIYESDYLALDYLNLPEKSAEAYGPNPLTGTGRVFRSGDLGRMLADGRIEFLGRKDFQVKIRGYRIELGEIEAILDDIPGIHKSIVAGFQKTEGDYYLAAYYTVSGGREPEKKELRRILGQKLPDYMIPSYFVRLEQLPLTPTGKVDRKALPEPEVGDIDTGNEYEAPQNETETKLVRIWREVLGIEKVGINDSFFELGGHSLNATNVIARIHKELNVELPLREIFNAPTVKELAKRIAKTEENIYSAIKLAQTKEYYQVSAAQKRMYIINQLDNSGISYNTPGAIIIEGELDKNRLERVFKTLIKRHDAFRTSFEMADGEPVQRIYETVDFEITYLKSEADQADRIIKEFIRSFDLSKAPLLRVCLIELSGNRHIMIYDTHHIISDGTSMAILNGEFIKLYNGEELPELRIQYKDYAEWQKKLFKSGKLKIQEEYWINRFSGEIPVLNLPTDYSRPVVQSFEGDRIEFETGPELTFKIKRMAAETGATVYMILLAAYNILLSKYSSQEDIVIGSPIAGRLHADLESIIGMFVNTLALRNYPEGKKSFRKFLSEVKEDSLKAYENQEYQFEELVEQLNLRRDLSRNPLFDVMFVLQNMDIKASPINDLRFIPYEFENKVAKFDLTLTAMEAGETIWLSFEYCTKLLRKETIQRMAGHYIQIITEIVTAPDRKLSEIEMLSEAEKQQILSSFNDTQAEYPREKTIQQLFEEQVERTPDATAVIFEEQQLTYQELNQKANGLAHVLREKGVKPDSIVGIMVHRSLEMIIGILGILKAGGAYLPIDPEYPAERISYMLKDSGTELLLTQTGLHAENLFGKTIIDIQNQEIYQNQSANLNKINTAKDLAYIIYTSGTTGQPKGSMIEHRNVVRLLFNERFQFDFNENDVWTMFHSYCFDFSVWEMYGALLYGGKLVVVTKSTSRDPKEYLKLLEKEKVTVLNQIPTVFYNLIEEMPESSSILKLRYVIFGGEALQPIMLKKWHQDYPDTKLINMYGITETTVHVTYKEIAENEINSNISNIGRPIPTLTTYILDRNLKLLPVGVIGELYVGGEGLGRGYLNRPELTAARFLPNPLVPGERIYKSGDLAKRLPNGEMEYLGRGDHQVKIRGHRIELGEIELSLLCHESIREAVVMAKEDIDGKGKYLCAYYVSEQKLTVLELREYLGKGLPDYMIPSYFVHLEKLPLTFNGKLDRKALPEPDGKVNTGVEYMAPRDEMEQRLATIWEELLQVEGIGIQDDFFKLGGNSLNATNVIARIHKELNVELPLREIFNAPTVKELAKRIAKTEENIYSAIKPAQTKEYYPVSAAQKRMYIINQLDSQGICYNMPGATIIKNELDKNRLEEVFKTLVKRHDAFRTSFEMADGEPVQRIHEAVDFEITYLKLEEDQVERIIKEFIRPFDLSIAPLLRVSLIELSGNRHIMIFDTHHIISDGTSMAILAEEFIRLYNGEELPELRIQYKDYSEWQNELFKTGKLKVQEEYWLSRFAGEIPVLNIPADYPQPPVMDFRGGWRRFEIDRELTAKLRHLASQNGATMFVILLAAYNVLLARLTGQEDIIVGAPIAGRRHADLEKVIGVFINIMALRNYPGKQKTFLKFLAEVTENTLNAFENQDYQFDMLLDRLKLKKDLSRNPLFDTVFDYLNMSVAGGGDNTNQYSLKIFPYELENETTKFDIVFYIIEAEGKIKINCNYRASLFESATIQYLTGEYVRLLEEISVNNDQPLKDYGIFKKENIRMAGNRVALVKRPVK
jgi:tyrocidine synthetase-3